MFLEDLSHWRDSPDVELLEIVDKGDPLWKKHVGVITELFKKTTITPDTQVVVCGPPIMFRFVLAELRKMGVPDSSIYLDLERRMKCGVGKCGHCQINDRYACLDGPVFSLDQVAKMEEAL